MEPIPLTQTDKGFNVASIPNAKKVIILSGKKAKRLADLLLHTEDLAFAADCLRAINSASAREEGADTLREALWRSAIVHFTKCFGDSIRFQLCAQKIYKGVPTGLVAFNYFKDLRNKHFIHDENSYLQCHPGAVLNDGKRAHKVEKVVCLQVRGVTLDQSNFSNLELLIKTAREWAEAEFEKQALVIKTDLEEESYETLNSQTEMSFKPPKLEDVGTKRAT